MERLARCVIHSSGDNDDPFAHMLTDLENIHSRNVLRKHPDRVRGTAEHRYDIDASKFVEIVTDSTSLKNMAFVDGGNGTLATAPNYLMSLNHVCYTIFRGAQKIPAGKNSVQQKITFLSCTVPRIDSAYLDDADVDDSTSAKSLRFDTKLYPYQNIASTGTKNEDDHNNNNDILGLLPDVDDLSVSGADAKTSIIQDAQLLPSVARSLAEIKLASKVVQNELESGDMLVIDGSLHTSFGVQKEYAAQLYDDAMKKNVIVCGLAKTTRLTTVSGEPLMGRIAEISKDVPYGRWYVPVAKKLYNEGRGFTVAAKLHPRSRFVFRLDILHEQYADMDKAGINSVMASLAGNSDDASIPGYPYGAIDADKRAKVRTSELAAFRRALYSQCSGNAQWQYLLKQADSVIFHDLLNKVTG